MLTVVTLPLKSPRRKKSIPWFTKRIKKRNLNWAKVYGVNISASNLNPLTPSINREIGPSTCSTRLVKFWKTNSWRRPSKIPRKYCHICIEKRLKIRLSVLKYIYASAMIDPASQSELILECFSIAFGHDNSYHSPTLSQGIEPYGSCANNQWCRWVYSSLSHGPDGLHPRILKLLATQYLALARPILEYGQQASSPYLRRDIALMESIPGLATRMVEGTRELPYDEYLVDYSLFP